MPTPDVQAEKTALRKRLIARRSGMPEPLRNGYSRLLRDHLLEFPQVSAAGTVAAYYSVGSEPSTRSLVYALWTQGHYVILPTLLPDGDLDWASYEGPDSMVPGPRGLLEPAEARRGTDAGARAGGCRARGRGSSPPKPGAAPTRCRARRRCSSPRWPCRSPGCAWAAAA